MLSNRFPKEPKSHCKRAQIGLRFGLFRKPKGVLLQRIDYQYVTKSVFFTRFFASYFIQIALSLS